MKPSTWLIGGAVVVGAVLLFIPTAEAQAAQKPSPAPGGARPMSDAELRVIRHVLAAESGGKYSAINANTDGAGVSLGLLQWSQAGGGLAELLDAWQRAEPQLLAGYLGGSTAKVLEVARARSLDPVDGVPLWSGVWLARWKAALADPSLRRVQDELVRGGVHMRAAVKAAGVLGVKSERGLALLFDRAVQQGPARVATAAAAVRERMGDTTEYHLLVIVANELVEPFRRKAAPVGSKPGRLTWKQVGDEWHLHSGAVDLYATSRRRVDAILQDDGFDVPTSSPPAVVT